MCNNDTSNPKYKERVQHNLKLDMKCNDLHVTGIIFFK